MDCGDAASASHAHRPKTSNIQMEEHMANQDAASNIEMPGESSAPVAAGRYVQLALLVCAAGAIYPMLYKGSRSA
ncbi:hypothetical protein WT37_15530 [Burkholderia territorii]|nr:hypothetical protein WT37_15530 [Burkholderia territorii]